MNLYILLTLNMTRENHIRHSDLNEKKNAYLISGEDFASITAEILPVYHNTG